MQASEILGEDTVDLELTEADLLRLAQAAAEQAHSEPQPVILASEYSPTAQSESEASSRELSVPLPIHAVAPSHTANLFGLAVAAALVGGALYFSTSPDVDKSVGARVEAAAAAIMPTATAAATAPAAAALDVQTVRVSNPFDADEVFEFPPGTSEAEARDAVAELLLQRAQDRMHSSSRVKRQNTAIESKNTTASARTVARRG